MLQDPDVVALALEKFRSRPSVGFSDCLMLEIARRAGHLPLGTFDRNLSKLAGTEKL
jgi:predicted nucleic acid-binding protein